MQKKLLAVMLFVAGSLFGQISFGIQIGPPPSPRVMRIRPANPGSGYMWVDGYWYPAGKRYTWHDGYWTRPPYEGANWASPRYDDGQYYQGFWSDGKRKVKHDHKWDRNRRYRDYDDDNGRGRGRR